MPFKRASCQSARSLEEFYADIATMTDEIHGPMARRMLELLPFLAETCAHHDVWGLTSLECLLLLPVDDWKTRWLVNILALPNPGRGYRIQYRLPAGEAPWSFVEGIANDSAAACRMILMAMDRSQGWPARS